MLKFHGLKRGLQRDLRFKDSKARGRDKSIVSVNLVFFGSQILNYLWALGVKEAVYLPGTCHDLGRQQGQSR